MNKDTPKRKYSVKTIKILFGLSGNQCAHPECENAVIEPPTARSDALVMAQICHIYAIKKDGPRGKAGLTEEELNFHENLMLLCPNHHTVVDGQHETYTAEMLKQWKQEHEARVMENRISRGLDSQISSLSYRSDFPTELVDQEIKRETHVIIRSRFFKEFDSVGSSLTLATRITKGELKRGTNEVRSKALAWCVRLLSDSQFDKAEAYLEQARAIGSCPEIDIAAAYISSRRGDKAAAMHKLAAIGSPMSRSASLMVIGHHDGLKEAVDWLKRAGVGSSILDSDGKTYLMACYLKLADWDASRKFLDVLTDEDMRGSPALYRMVAVTHLLTAVPDELRSQVVEQPPFEGEGFPIASDSEALEARRTARRCFIDAAKIARQLNCPLAEKIDNGYALWLELKDPDTRDEGRMRLASQLRDPSTALYLVPLGVHFEIEFDEGAVELEIERQDALHGGITSDTAIARLALAFKQPTPADAANYIARHQESIADYVDKDYLRCVQIELLARAGKIEEAQKRMDFLSEGGISQQHERRLRGIIDEVQGADPLERYKKQFREQDSLDNLQLLVYVLETRQDSEGLCEYGGTLFGKTRSLQDAERFATALFNAQQTERLAEFLESNSSLLTLSDNLQLLHCWTLYADGALLDARREMGKLDADWDHPFYRTLQIKLAISMGDWNSVSAFVANECREKEKRNPQELIATAQLALHLDSVSQAKELTLAAVEKGNDDADILGTAYVIATRAGWEDKEVSHWIQKAAAISGDNGPIRRFTVKDFLDRKPDWEERDSEISRQLVRGDLPMYLAAQARNMSLGGVMLFSALANLDECDPRRKDVIPAYSGQRQSTQLETGGHIGIDATALLTLSLLGVLDEALDAFETVHIPHSTFGWLFEEKQRVTFHQPSRIADAHRIRDLLDYGALEEISPTTIADSNLAELVGVELAQFIAEASKNENDPQRIVVQSAPVLKVTSSMEEEADLTAYAGVLSSCQTVVDMLRQNGQITANEEQVATAYFQLNEKTWPNQPKIDEGAVLYLDDSAVYVFLHLGMLGKLRDAGFRSVISRRMISETRKLISYESISGKAKDAIDRIRRALNARLESGKIKVSRRLSVKHPKDRFVYEHPTAGVLEFPKWCDKVIVDDRILNQHPPPMYSTLDLLDALVAQGVISAEKRLEYRTQLRQAGYHFVSFSEDELAHHLGESAVKNGRVVETAELKAIRDNILKVRMSTLLQLPREKHWLETLQQTCHRVLKGLWRANADFEDARARSDWILRLIDLRGWAHAFPKEEGHNIVGIGHAGSIFFILQPPIEEPDEVKCNYWGWVEERVLAPLKEQYPDLYRNLLESYKRQISHVVDRYITEMNEDDNRH